MVPRSLSLIRSMLFLNRLKIETLRDLRGTFMVIRSWPSQFCTPFLSSLAGTHGNKERQNTCVIVWPRTHKRLHADSSRLEAADKSEPYDEKFNFLPLSDTTKCYNCNETRRDTSERWRRYYDFRNVSLVSDNLLSLLWLGDKISVSYNDNT